MNLHQRLSRPDSPANRDDAPAASLLERYLGIRNETESLAERLTPEDQTIQSMPDTSPAKWHRAHTTWFFETFILSQSRSYRSFREEYAYLFNSYYEAVGPRQPRSQRGLLTKPSAVEIGDYRAHIDEAMMALLQQRGDDAEVVAIVELGLQHEQQHQELLLTDILHTFAQNPLRPAFLPFRASPSAPTKAPAFVAFEGGRDWFGHSGDGFAFDNEGPRHEAILVPFRLANGLVTNAEWLEFMEAGGYREPLFWLADGWQRSRDESWSAPLYWEKHGDIWYSMTLAGMQPVDPDAPVAHVSLYEADAFARWRGKRLPTELEWEHVARKVDPQLGNYREHNYLRPLAAEDGRDMQLFGDVWEWTQSPYMPYPGFRPSDGAVGEYNGKFMINQMVLRGGSCVSNRDHLRATYRNFFYPHQRWQFMGLRLAEDSRLRRSATLRTTPTLLDDVWEGLSRKQKALPSKYFYDGEGSRLFEAICELPEYYLTRTETALLERSAVELAALIKPNTVLVEFGCGACAKTRILLDGIKNITAYVPIDICSESLRRSVSPLAAEFPRVAIEPLAVDFMQPFKLPEQFAGRPVLGYFSGSTIGNLLASEAEQFLQASRDTLGDDARFLVAIDLVKNEDVLLRAYDDAQGVTSAFNKNLLVRINRELDGNFPLEDFSHKAIWNAAKKRIEMHLLSSRRQHVTIKGRSFAFEPGETVHTENSHKYTLGGFTGLAGRSGWAVSRVWSSPPPAFALVLLR